MKPITLQKKKITLDNVTAEELMNDGVLQAEMALEALRQGKVHKFNLKPAFI